MLDAKAYGYFNTLANGIWIATRQSGKIEFRRILSRHFLPRSPGIRMPPMKAKKFSSPSQGFSQDSSAAGGDFSAGFCAFFSGVSTCDLPNFLLRFDIVSYLIPPPRRQSLSYKPTCYDQLAHGNALATVATRKTRIPRKVH